ncbi:MAG: histidine--tRNA ligase, partial [bacterium]
MPEAPSGAPGSSSGPAPRKVESVRGTQDLLPGDSARWREAEGRVRRILAAYAFQEIRTPLFEHAELFRRPLGLGSDVVAKEMYEFTDRGDWRLALRPEGTAPAARAFIEHGLYAKGSRHKLWYEGPIFRYDRPQAGRYRQHHQFGVEVFGSADPAQDAEVIALGRAVLDVLEIQAGEYRILLNSNGDPACRPAYEAALRAWLQERAAALCGDCRGHRLEHNVLRVLDCKVPPCREATKEAPRITDHLCADCRAHHEALVTYLDAMRIETVADPRLVRGFDYYTRTAFEFVASSGGEAGTLLGGGRYDGLVELLGGPATPAVGWGMGIERVLARSPLQGPEDGPRVFVVSLAPGSMARCMKIADALRALGVRCEIGAGGSSANSQMRAAD